MNTYTIVLERISTGKYSRSMVTLQENDEAAWAYALPMIARDLDLRVALIFHW